MRKVDINIKAILENKKLYGIWTALLFVLSTYVTTFLIQYLLLEPELFDVLSDTRWGLNRACVLIVYCLVLCVTNRVGLSIIISHAFFMILAFVNYYVYLSRESEFLFADIRAIGTGLSVAANYKLQLNEKGWQVILISIALFVIAGFIRIRFEKAMRLRVLSCLAAIFLCITITEKIDAFDTETWQQKGTYQNGYVLNFVLSARDSFVVVPEEYEIETIKGLEQAYAVNRENALGDNLSQEPTIIVVMNESFADLRVLGAFETNEPITPFMDSLYDNVTKGYALTSIFGAKTPNSEWEFLTGGSMAFLPAGSVVYQQYMNDSPSSMVSTLKNQGYTCVAMHPYYESGWSRDQVYPALGFDESYFIEDFDESQIVRQYISDKEMYRKIIERFESQDEKEPLFIMSVSMQNHGGYETSYENFEEKYYEKSQSYADVNQYLSLVHESDDALRELINYFESVEEPVEIVFFGDHQPSLNSEFYEMLKGDELSILSLEEKQALYTVPFFIWTNYDTPEETIEMTSLSYLSTLTLVRAGIDLPPYNQFIADLMEVVPAMNVNGYYSIEQGKYVNIEDASGRELDWLNKYESLQYNALFDLENKSSVFFPYLGE